MITFLLRTLIYIVSAGLGLIAADLLLDGFRIEWSKWWGFVLCILIFALLQSVLSPWISKLADRHAPVLLGGIGIFSTLIALIIVVLLPIGGLRIVDVTGLVARRGDRLARHGFGNDAAAADLPQAQGRRRAREARSSRALSGLRSSSPAR